jgi:hypothetical protein
MIYSVCVCVCVCVFLHVGGFRDITSLRVLIDEGEENYQVVDVNSNTSLFDLYGV